MPLRVAFDMDGTLADFDAAFREYEARLFGLAAVEARTPEPEAREQDERKAADQGAGETAEGEPPPGFAGGGEFGAPAHGEPRLLRRKLDLVWRAIESTANFWTTLKPIDPAAVRHIHEVAERHRWEVFFITQRPATDGDTVQRQTQRWLIAQGFDMPSVIVISGSRGKIASALRLDYLVDDNPKNCVDVISDSNARVLLIVRDADEHTEASARRLGIGVVHSIAECVDILERATEMCTQPTLLQRLGRLVGWRTRS